jgi:hypothetical protein
MVSALSLLTLTLLCCILLEDRFPVILLIFFIFYLLVQTGTVAGDNQDFMDKIEASDSYAALLWGTMAAAICATIFYLLQIVRDGELVHILDYPAAMKEMFMRSFCGKNTEEDEVEDPTSKARFLMSVYDSLESFLFGMKRIFPALIVLTLAWASGAVMIAVGADRLFSRWIVGG